MASHGQEQGKELLVLTMEGMKSVFPTVLAIQAKQLALTESMNLTFSIKHIEVGIWTKINA